MAKTEEFGIRFAFEIAHPVQWMIGITSIKQKKDKNN